MKSKTRILLVEDTPINQQLVVLFLETEQCEVDIANNGAEAVQLVEKADYNLILMDLSMPVMDGFEAATIIKSHHNSAIANIPIVALTACIDDQSRQKCFDCGMAEFVTKPFDKATLIGIINRWTSSE